MNNVNSNLIKEEILSKKTESTNNPLAAFQKKNNEFNIIKEEIKENIKDPNKSILIKISDIVELRVNGEIMHNRCAMAQKEQEELQLFANSIKLDKSSGAGLYQTGLINPITVRESAIEKGKYELIAGFRRTEAFKLNKEDKIPAFVFECDDRIARRLRNVENKQRRSLNVYDEVYGELEEIISILEDYNGKYFINKNNERESFTASKEDRKFQDFNIIYVKKTAKFLMDSKGIQYELFDTTYSKEEAEKLLKKYKKILEEQNSLRKEFNENDVSTMKIEEFFAKNSKYKVEDHIDAANLNSLIDNAIQKKISTFVNKLKILHIHPLIKDEMYKNNIIDSSKAASMSKVLKDNAENIQKAIDYLYAEEGEGNLISSQAFEKWLKEEFAYIDKNRGYKETSFSISKKIFSMIKETDIEKLPAEEKNTVNIMFEEMKSNLEEIQAYIKSKK